MKTVLLATDSDELFSSVDSAIGSQELKVLRVRKGSDVVPAVNELDPDLVLLDLQIGNMGGVASCLALRQEEGAGRLEVRKIALLLDRTADEFLAETSGADGWLTKPIKASELNAATSKLLS